MQGVQCNGCFGRGKLSLPGMGDDRIFRSNTTRHDAGGRVSGKQEENIKTMLRIGNSYLFDKISPWWHYKIEEYKALSERFFVRGKNSIYKT